MKLLGAWYSNNSADRWILCASLSSIRAAQLAATRATVDVRTCTWEPVGERLFSNIPARYRLGTHLGIAMQILQIVYAARDDGGELPDAVCFLEHDVLYPPDYFDRVAAALEAQPEKVGVINHHFCGLRIGGWCETTQHDEPMHQMAMRFGPALEHLGWVVLECVRLGARCVEPDSKAPFAKLEPEDGQAPAVHICHDRHFTSHPNIYAKEPWTERHPAWGDWRQYYPPAAT